MRQLLLLRPEPGLASSVARAEALGLDVIARPLFRIEPVDWDLPDPGRYEALLLTSANAIRQAGPGLSRFRHLPAYAVGRATADAAREAGLKIAEVGEGGVDDLLAGIAGSPRLLHLAGEQRRPAETPHAVDEVIVYRSIAIEDPGLRPLQGLVAAIHSPRAGARLAELAPERGRTKIAAISAAAAATSGQGWEGMEVAEAPDDRSLLALAAMLCHTSPPE